ncbi:MAG TPA: porphobilinogen synthase, partial [Myxococcota bacterium]|nr:porphobilinogen synthase [Myxococcota bacterium]
MQRLRRLRRTDSILRLFAETDVPARCLIPVVFVVEGHGIRREVPEGGGMWQLSVDQLPAEAERAQKGGAEAMMLFGVPPQKGLQHATDPNSLVARGLQSLRGRGLTLMADVCLCSYTDDGHCGIWHEGHVDNDMSLPYLAKMAVQLADAGADVVCPSDMMDGRVAAIRQALDDGGHSYTLLMSYAAKMASAFYGPFRAAAESAPTHGDRRGYQMNPANRREAHREIEADVYEGADLLMIKPALTNLDLIRETRERYDLPIVAYQVSGEYAMLKEAGRAG